MELPTRIVDTREYVSMLRELTEQGNEVRLLISGSSMAPFLIHRRDSICFRKPDRPLKRGDMVFFQRDSGQFVMHRILRVAPEGYYIVGDNQTEVEGPVRREQIFGLITRAQRKGKWIEPGDFWWRFFAGAWLTLLPVRPVIVKCYGALRRPFRAENRTENRTQDGAQGE